MTVGKDIQQSKNMRHKIVHIITRLDKGGSSENVLLTVTHFAEKGYECILIYGNTTNPPTELISKAEKADVKFIRVDKLVRSISPVCDFLAFLRLLCLLRFLRPDIVHTHSSKAGILGRWSIWLYNFLSPITNHQLPITKTVHTPHGHVFYGYYGRTITTIFMMIEKITAIITDKLVALNEGEKNESLAYGIGRPEQWEVIHSGIDISGIRHPVSDIRKELGISKDAIVVGSVGRLDPVKGYKYFIEAIKILDTRCQIPDTRFLIVGDGSERKNLELIIHNSELKNRIIFTGWRNDVEEIISLMDIYVQPSINEGMGKTLIQAQMLGKPIIATKVQGIPSVVKDGVTGILVPPRNSIALAEAIIRVIRDENFRKKMGEEERKWVAEIVDGYPRFGTERMFRLIEKLYTRLLEGERKC